MTTLRLPVSLSSAPNPLLVRLCAHLFSLPGDVNYVCPSFGSTIHQQLLTENRCPAGTLLRTVEAQTVALDHYSDLVETMMGRFVAINSGVEKTVSGCEPFYITIYLPNPKTLDSI